MTAEIQPAPSATAPAPAAPPRRLFTATLILGTPGAGKTSLFATFAEYLWETWKMILLLYSWDGGAIPTDVQRRMKQGLIRFWRARTRSGEGLGLETLYLASRGYWPARINAVTGETAPNVRLVAPVTIKYVAKCPAGHTLMVTPAPAAIVPMHCQGCARAIAQTEMTITEELTRSKGFEQVGGVGFDGLSSMSDVVLDHMDDQRGAGNIQGEKAAFGGIVTSGVIKAGGNNRADIGFGQSRARRFVQNSLSIPYLVEGPVFTALSMEATDEGGLPIVGAKLPGRAATDEASAWFGNVAEMGQEVDDSGKKHFVLYLRRFTDKQGRDHLLKTSGSPFGIPDKLVDPPLEERRPFEQVNLGLVFRMLDADLVRSLQQELPGAPGIPTEMMEYGEPYTIETPSSAYGPISIPSGIPAMGGGPRMAPHPMPAIAQPLPMVMPQPAPQVPAPLSAQPQTAGAPPAVASQGLASPGQPAVVSGPPAAAATLPPVAAAPPAAVPRRSRSRKPNGAGADGSAIPIVGPATAGAPPQPQVTQVAHVVPAVAAAMPQFVAPAPVAAPTPAPTPVPSPALVTAPPAVAAAPPPAQPTLVPPPVSHPAAAPAPAPPTVGPVTIPQTGIPVMGTVRPSPVVMPMTGTAPPPPPGMRPPAKAPGV